MKNFSADIYDSFGLFAGFFCLGVPEIVYCNYQDDEVHDVVVIENLIKTGE